MSLKIKKNYLLLILISLFFKDLLLIAQEKEQKISTKNQMKQFTVEEMQESHKTMLKWLKVKAEATKVENRYLGKTRLVEINEKLKEIEMKKPRAKAQWVLYNQAGMTELYHGSLEKAIEHYDKAYSLIPKAQLNIMERVQTNFYRGVAYLRMGETQNCCLKNLPQSCILPLQPIVFHTEKEGSTKAIQDFEEILKLMENYVKDEAMETFEDGIKWLLNIAYMTLGEYPQQVPTNYLIPPDCFKSKIPFPRFKNIAPQLKLNTFNLSGGAIIDDFDNDGYLDIVTSGWEPNGQLRFFHNETDGTFSEQSEKAGLAGLCGGLNMMQTDYNNDGHLDIFILRGAWLGETGNHPNSLLHNNGDGTFYDVTILTGLGKENYPTQTASWADYDNDGDLDLYIGNEYQPHNRVLSQLFQNNNGLFTDVALQAGVSNRSYAKSVAWGDYNGDGFMDIYVSNFGKPNRLYKNNQDGTFTNVAAQQKVSLPKFSFPSWFWDFDNDGDLDLFVASYSGDYRNYGRACFGKSTLSEFSCCYQNNGQGEFIDITKEQNLNVVTLAMGSNFGDLNNDGFLDFYLGTGTPKFENIFPNYMFLNNQGKNFTDVSMAGGFAHLQKGHSVAFGDLDNDGDLDIFEQMGGAYHGDEYTDVLYENPGFKKNWIAIKLIGTFSNRVAIGARIHLQIREQGKMRSIYRHINSGGSFGANPFRQTIGLGSAEEIELLEIFWPTTNKTQQFQKVTKNQFIQIKENEKSYTQIKLKKINFSPEKH